MAAASLSAMVKDVKIRKYGGNRSSVRNKLYYYQNLTKEEFQHKHPITTKVDFEKFLFKLRLNKR